MNNLSSSYILILLFLFPSFLLCLVVQYILKNDAAVHPGFYLGMIFLVVANSVVALAVLKKLLESEYRAALFKQQARAVEEIHALARNIRSARHDFLNHLQTVYGLLQLKKADAALSYLAEVIREARTATVLLNLKVSEAGALLQAKANQASALGIPFSLSVHSDLENLTVPAHHLNRVLGNLIDNAFEAVIGLEPEERFVKVSISEEEENYILEVLNSGPELKPELQKKIFTAGFSTKGGDRGLGLDIVHEIITRYGGTISVSSPPTVFTVRLPKRPQGQLPPCPEHSGSPV
ncbi:MAG: sensor histidine kinase [Desulfotomaculales bacterium]